MPLGGSRRVFIRRARDSRRQAHRRFGADNRPGARRHRIGGRSRISARNRQDTSGALQSRSVGMNELDVARTLVVAWEAFVGAGRPDRDLAVTLVGAHGKLITTPPPLDE